MNSWLMHALSVMLVFCSRDAISCPKRCTCHFSAKSTEVVCPDAGLSHFPGDGLPGNTTSLTIQFTNLTVLTSQHLKAIPQLEELHLPGNKLSSLPADLLKDLHYLHTIDLTGESVCIKAPYRLVEVKSHMYFEAMCVEAAMSRLWSERGTSLPFY